MIIFSLCNFTKRRAQYFMVSVKKFYTFISFNFLCSQFTSFHSCIFVLSFHCQLKQNYERNHISISTVSQRVIIAYIMGIFARMFIMLYLLRPIFNISFCKSDNFVPVGIGFPNILVIRSKLSSPAIPARY